MITEPFLCDNSNEYSYALLLKKLPRDIAVKTNNKSVALPSFWCLALVFLFQLE